MKYQSWISKALENLAAAQLCFDHGHFNACANRLYYAMFQAGAAALFNMIFCQREIKSAMSGCNQIFRECSFIAAKYFLLHSGPIFLMRKPSVILQIMD